MNVWIASDIHGSALYCRKLLDLMEKRGADRLVLLGDLLYHGPRNDLPEGYDPKAGLCHAEQREGPDPLCPRQL